MPDERGRPLHELDLPTARWLVSSEGLAAVADATAVLDAAGTAADGVGALDRPELDLASRARRRWPQPGRAPAVVAAAIARRRARPRWPDADRLLFTRTGLEQASHPAVSAWRAHRFAGSDDGVWDLAAGIGGDTLALAAVTGPVRAIDLDAARLVLLDHNAQMRGLAVATEAADALAVRPPAGVRLHADPGRRRADGRRVSRLTDHHPPVGALVAAHPGVRGFAVVLSPAVPLDDPQLPPDAELEFVGIDDRLVEAVAWLGDVAVPGRAATATLLRPGTAEPVSIARDRGTRVELPVGPVGDHLLEVAAPAVRARLHDDLGAEVGARRVARGRALLTVDGVPPPSPWYLARPVLAVLPARPKPVRAWLRDQDVTALELVLHGMATDPTAWWRALGRPPRGPNGWRLELIRLDAGATAVVTGPAQRT